MLFLSQIGITLGGGVKSRMALGKGGGAGGHGGLTKITYEIKKLKNVLMVYIDKKLVKSIVWSKFHKLLHPKAFLSRNCHLGFFKSEDPKNFKNSWWHFQIFSLRVKI